VSADQDSRQAAQINAFFNKTLMMEEVRPAYKQQ
jgi:hypothetical protein